MSSRDHSEGGWRDDLTSKRDVDGCLACSKPTKSHVVLMAYDDDADELRPTTNVDETDAVGNVCHGCYETTDADAERLVEKYEAWLRGLCSTNGTDLETLVRAPEDVDADLIAAAEGGMG